MKRGAMCASTAMPRSALLPTVCATRTLIMSILAQDKEKTCTPCNLAKGRLWNAAAGVGPFQGFMPPPPAGAGGPHLQWGTPAVPSSNEGGVPAESSSHIPGNPWLALQQSEHFSQSWGHQGKLSLKFGAKQSPLRDYILIQYAHCDFHRFYCSTSDAPCEWLSTDRNIGYLALIVLTDQDRLTSCISKICHSVV